MKKFIAVLAMVALVSGALFAQVGGYAFGAIGIENVIVSEGDNPDAMLFGGMGRINLEASADSDDGQFGVWMRFRGVQNTPEVDGEWMPNVGVWGSAFWKPIDQVKFQIGTNPDNHFGADRITRWGFYQRIGDMGLVDVGNNYWNPYNTFSDNIFFGGWSNGGYGAILTITPVREIAINIGIPLAALDGEADFQPAIIFGANQMSLFDAVTSSVVQVAAFIPDVGNAFVTYSSAVAYAGNDSYDVVGKIFANFNLTAIDGVGVDVGVSYDLGSEEVGFGLGAEYNTEEFGIKLRVLGTTFTGMIADGDARKEGDGLNLAVDLLPSYAINDNLKVFCSVGIQMANATHDWADWAGLGLGFHVNPWIMASIGWDRNFYAGVRIFQAPGDEKVNWAIPILIVASF